MKEDDSEDYSWLKNKVFNKGGSDTRNVQDVEKKDENDPERIRKMRLEMKRRKLWKMRLQWERDNDYPRRPPPVKKTADGERTGDLEGQVKKPDEQNLCLDLVKKYREREAERMREMRRLSTSWDWEDNIRPWLGEKVNTLRPKEQGPKSGGCLEDTTRQNITDEIKRTRKGETKKSQDSTKRSSSRKEKTTSYPREERPRPGGHREHTTRRNKEEEVKHTPRKQGASEPYPHDQTKVVSYSRKDRTESPLPKKTKSPHQNKDKKKQFPFEDVILSYLREKPTKSKVRNASRSKLKSTISDKIPGNIRKTAVKKKVCTPLQTPEKNTVPQIALKVSDKNTSNIRSARFKTTLTESRITPFADYVAKFEDVINKKRREFEEIKLKVRNEKFRR